MYTLIRSKVFSLVVHFALACHASAQILYYIYIYNNPIWNILNHDTVVRFSLDTFLHYHLPDSVVFAHGIVSKSKKEELGATAMLF